MKKLIYGMILTGTAVFSLVILTSFGCGSPDQLGEGGNSGGGVAGNPVIKMDGSPPGQGGNSGGAAGSGSLPTGDANCGSSTSKTTREPPDVLLLLDCSSSMLWNITQDCFCSEEDIAASGAGRGELCSDTANCSNRWSAVKPAVVDTVANSQDVHWGLKFFPTPGGAQCSVSSTMEVPIGPDTKDAVRSQVESVSLSLSTPTAQAIKVATAYLQTLTDNRPKFILLATDGEPNCRGGQIMNDDLEGAAAAAEDAYDAGFPVFVVGIGPNLGNLTRIASDGGTDDYYPVESPQQLVDAFAAISKLVASCTFTLSLEPGADLENVGVYLDKNLVPKDPENGWSFGGGQQTVILNGDACEKVTSGQATTVEVLVGCENPPDIIP
ncbi:MAG: VWA domain-containing protein [Deltaproteobacteria bacterium]|nr:VWA domain-containing protein [Deltaproteobacteria bacterium]